MKNHIIRIAAIAALGFFATACQKESLDDNSTDVSIAQSSTNSSDMVEGSVDEAAFRMAEGSSGCATVTWANAIGTFPNTCTIDFGTGCTGRNGRIIAGQIIVEESAGYFEAGSVRHITTNNLTVDGNSLEFDRTVTNLGLSEGTGQMSWSVVVTGTRVKASDGSTATWSANRTRTMTAGLETPEVIEDDVYEITGTDTGTCHQGNTFTATITTPLVKAMSCHWIQSGVVEIESDGRRGDRSIDFGDGTCDNKATLTTPRGSREITIRR
jgi:hypothetical protein